MVFLLKWKFVSWALPYPSHKIDIQYNRASFRGGRSNLTGDNAYTCNLPVRLMCNIVDSAGKSAEFRPKRFPGAKLSNSMPLNPHLALPGTNSHKRQGRPRKRFQFDTAGANPLFQAAKSCVSLLQHIAKYITVQVNAT
jgi:hypothetical protein